MSGHCFHHYTTPWLCVNVFVFFIQGELLPGFSHTHKSVLLYFGNGVTLRIVLVLVVASVWPLWLGQIRPLVHTEHSALSIAWWSLLCHASVLFLLPSQSVQFVSVMGRIFLSVSLLLKNVHGLTKSLPGCTNAMKSDKKMDTKTIFQGLKGSQCLKFTHRIFFGDGSMVIICTPDFNQI